MIGFNYRKAIQALVFFGNKEKGIIHKMKGIGFILRT